MRATYVFGAGDVRVVDAPDPIISEPTDALVRVVNACVCGSDPHPFHSLPDTPEGTPMGHEFVGVIEDVGREVSTLTRGDLVIAPFAWSDGTCVLCLEGLQTSCLHGGFWGTQGIGGAQAEAVRVPFADGTLVKVPTAPDAELLPSQLTLSDVYGTGWHAAVRGGVIAGSTVTVIGDGAVGLLAVLSAKQLGADRVILMGRHLARTDLGEEFGATDVVAERGEEGIAAVRELTGGLGSDIVIEAVGHMPAYEQAIGVVRPGGVISRVVETLLPGHQRDGGHVMSGHRQRPDRTTCLWVITAEPSGSHPRMETGDERYAFVNTTFFVGQGRLLPGPRVEYQVFRVEN